MINPNTRHNPEKLSLFIDSLFCYGQDYGDLNQYGHEVIKHRAQRLKAIGNITILLKVIYACKDEIKHLNCHKEDDSLKMLVQTSVNIVYKFFESLKKNLKRAEEHINFGSLDVGHLIPLNVGHLEKPSEEESKYIQFVMDASEFKYVPDEDELFQDVTNPVEIDFKPEKKRAIKRQMSVTNRSFNNSFFKNFSWKKGVNQNDTILEDDFDRHSLRSMKSMKSRFEVEPLNDRKPQSKF